jgi:ubiquinone/menaquinone biosynthesis C-methylase UbiE
MKSNSTEIMNNKWYDSDYATKGFAAQRLYPNEELLRFMGRNFFHLNKNERKKIKILESGCGSCSNLWMVAKEGFDAYGIDFSPHAIKLGKKMLKKWNVKAHLNVANMLHLPFNDNFFEVVLDVFSANCLVLKDYEIFVSEVSRVLKPGGLFFTYTPSVNSDAFKNIGNARKLDKFTLNGIHRKSAPFYGHFHPFRFDSLSELKKVYLKYGLNIRYAEKITRTYNGGKEKFQHLSIEALKQ